MDMTRNLIPADVRRVHLIAVCGTAMGALAGMLKDLGWGHRLRPEVYPPMSHFLAEHGIHMIEGFRPANLAHRPDLVVVGNVIPRTILRRSSWRNCG